MKLVGALIALALLTGACGKGGLVDGKDVVCGAAETWLSADPATRTKLSGTVKSTLDTFDDSEDVRVREAVDLVRRLIDGEELSQAAKKVEQYCD